SLLVGGSLIALSIALAGLTVGVVSGVCYLALKYPDNWFNEVFRGLVRQKDWRLFFFLLPSMASLVTHLVFSDPIEYLKARSRWKSWRNADISSQVSKASH